MKKPLYKSIDTDRFQDAEIVLQRLPNKGGAPKIRVHKGDKYFGNLIAIGGFRDATEQEVLRGLRGLEVPTDVLWLPPDTYEVEFTYEELRGLVQLLDGSDDSLKELKARLQKELEG